MSLRNTVILLLAAGRSSRFAGGDKLLAAYRGRLLLEHAAGLLEGAPVAARIAVAAPDRPARAALLRAAGWDVLECAQALSGQGASLAAGIGAAAGHDRAEAALVLLADMPEVPGAHLHALQDNHAAGHPAVLTRVGEALSPPAIFGRALFPRLQALSGDAGARQILGGMAGIASVPLDPRHALDIDTREDLARAAEGAVGLPPPARD